ncbi:MAG: PilZ domain-containing protein [Candidatus Omnitrophota bacterium]
MEYTGKEKRKFPRTDHAYTISFKKHNDPAADWDISNTMDLSLGGAFFISREFLPPDTELDINLKIPSQKEDCKCLALVKRCNGPVKNTYYKIAANFKHQDKLFQEPLKRSLDFFLNQ